MNIVSRFLNRMRGKPDPVLAGGPNFGRAGIGYVSTENCMEASAFYSGVIYISTQIAKLPWHVKDSENEKINDGVSYLLNVSPNKEITSFFLRLFLIQCAIIEGNGYCEIERTFDGRPLALWPLNPKRVTLERDIRTDELFYRVDGGGHGGETVYLQPRDVFHVKNFHTLDGLTGMGLIGYAKNTLGIAIAADTFANALYANGGLPSGVLTTPGKLSEAAAERMAKSWKENHGGRKTGGTALLEEGVKYEPISHNPEVLQFLQTRQFQVIEICRYLRIPPTKLFVAEAAKYNNIEHSNLEVTTDVLDAWTRNLETEADFKLLSGQRGGKRTEFDLYAVFRGDMQTRSKYFNTMMQSAAMTPNEIRKKEGEAPYEGGDRYYIATNNFTPVDRMDEVIDSDVQKKKGPLEDAESENLTTAAIEYLKRQTNG